jgi:serine/threonine-protein kinase HipA
VRPGELAVYLNGERIATLHDAGQGYAALVYGPEIVAARLGAPLVSVSLPVRSELYPGVETRAFLDGLLPEGDARRQIAARYGLEEADVFGFLAAIGGDCAGALSFLPADAPPPAEDETDVEWLDEGELARHIRELPLRPLADDPEGRVRISLAGAQPKLALVRDPETGRVGLPRGTTPSTHIVKPANPLRLGDGELAFPELVENEAYCLRVARHAGLLSAAGRVETLGGVRCLVVERYDRIRREDGRVLRLHQEDACQALRIPPARKYEEHGGPGLVQIADLVRRTSSRVAQDLPALLDRVAVSFVLGDDDAHGKNVSLLHTGAGVRLAPAYDLVSTAVYPALTPGLAMRIGGEVDGDLLTAEHWRRELAACGLGTVAAARRLAATGTSIVAAVESARADARARGFEAPVLEAIAGVAACRATALTLLA